MNADTICNTIIAVTAILGGVIILTKIVDRCFDVLLYSKGWKRPDPTTEQKA